MRSVLTATTYLVMDRSDSRIQPGFWVSGFRSSMGLRQGEGDFYIVIYKIFGIFFEMYYETFKNHQI